MRLSELTSYAAEKYQFREEHKWPDFPGFSVLADPQTGKWLALLMRIWDPEEGVELERCDLKCGRNCLRELPLPYLTTAFRMRGWNWVGIAMDDSADAGIVRRLFDRAVAAGRQAAGTTIVLENPPTAAQGLYHDTRIFPASALLSRPRQTEHGFRKIANGQGRIGQMISLYVHGDSPEKNFYRQAKFMEDYEDNAPWDDYPYLRIPTYHALNFRQLRGYFTWRAKIRKGEFSTANPPLVLLYFFELLNLVGASSPEDALKKMKEFVAGYFGQKEAQAYLQHDLRKWMMDFAIVHRMPVETARQFVNPEVLAKDTAMAALQQPAIHSDEEVFDALCKFGERRFALSPVVARQETAGKHLFAEAWRHAVRHCSMGGKDLFSCCFGQLVTQLWSPFGAAIYDWEHDKPSEMEYVLDEGRKYCFRNNDWREEKLSSLDANPNRFHEFLHEADRQLRRYLKTGRHLHEKAEEAWAAPFIEAVIAADRQARIEAARPVVNIDLTGLDKIRQDALQTQDSLLTDADRQEETPKMPEMPPEPPHSKTPPAAPSPEPEGHSLSLTPLQLQLLKMLLAGSRIDNILITNNLIPSVVADDLNEACFGEVGDSVVECDGRTLSLVEDYREDLKRIIDGKNNE